MLNSRERHAMSRARLQIDRGSGRRTRRKGRGVIWVTAAVIGIIAVGAYLEGYLAGDVAPVRAQHQGEQPVITNPQLPGGIEIEVIQRRP